MKGILVTPIGNLNVEGSPQTVLNSDKLAYAITADGREAYYLAGLFTGIHAPWNVNAVPYLTGARSPEGHAVIPMQQGIKGNLYVVDGLDRPASGR